MVREDEQGPGRSDVTADEEGQPFVARGRPERNRRAERPRPARSDISRHGRRRVMVVVVWTPGWISVPPRGLVEGKDDVSCTAVEPARIEFGVEDDVGSLKALEHGAGTGRV